MSKSLSTLEHDGLTRNLLRQVDRIFGPRDLLSGVGQLSAFDIAANRISLSIDEARFSSSRRMLGVDYGQEVSYALLLGDLPDLNGNTLCVLHVETMLAFEGHGSRDIDRIAELAEQFDVERIIDDANGIGHDRHRILSKMVQDKQVLAAFFDSSAYAHRDDTKSRPRVTEGKVVLNKVTSLASLLSAIRNGRVLIPDSLSSIELLERHLTSLSVKITAAGPRNVHQQVVKYHHADDHLLCCLMYARAGFWEEK